jgi:hypothetical protein
VALKAVNHCPAWTSHVQLVNYINVSAVDCVVLCDPVLQLQVSLQR